MKTLDDIRGAELLEARLRVGWDGVQQHLESGLVLIGLWAEVVAVAFLGWESVVLALLFGGVLGVSRSVIWQVLQG